MDLRGWICVSRCPPLRLKYAGVPVDRIEVISEPPLALDAALASAADGRLFVLPTYTALLELRDELTARRHVDAFWEAPR